MTSPRHAESTSQGRYYTHPTTGQRLVSVNKGGLDPRVVTRVKGRMVGLRISDDYEAWPCPRANYTFTRRVTEAVTA